MGLYDTITWHADLPDLPEGICPWSLAFQTKSLPGCCQRLIELTHEGQLQLREYIGEIIDPEGVSLETVHQVTDKLRLMRERLISGETLSNTDYSIEPVNYSGEIVFYASYGTPRNGRLEYQAVFEGGVLQDVQLTKNRGPDQIAWDTHQGKAGSKNYFVIQAISDNSKGFGDD